MWLLSDGVNPYEIHRTIEKILWAETLIICTKRDKEYKMKRDSQSLKTLPAGNRQDKLTQRPIHTAPHEKGRMTRGGANYPTHLPGTFLFLPTLVVFLGFCHCPIWLQVPVRAFLFSYPYSPAEDPTMFQPPCPITTQISPLTYLKKFLGVFNHKSHPIV